MTYDEENHVGISSASILNHPYPEACQYFLPVLVLVDEKHWTTGVHCTFQTTQLYRSCIIDFYSIILHVSAVCFSPHQVGVLVHKKSKKGEACPHIQWE